MGRLIHPDLAIAGIAAGQEGVVDYEQLREAGIGRGSIYRRSNTGRLHRVHEGVYLAGHPVATRDAEFHAALRACGSGSCLSHRSGSEHWVLIRPDPRDRAIDVTIPGRSGRRRPGIRIHRPRHLDPRDVTILRGIAVTTVARTLLDLGEAVDFRLLERAFDEALTRHLTTPRELRALIDRSPGRRGGAPLRRLLERASASSAWPSRPTAARTTRLARSAGRTTAATPTCARTAGRSSASSTTRSRRSPRR